MTTEERNYIKWEDVPKLHQEGVEQVYYEFNGHVNPWFTESITLCAFKRLRFFTLN